ncbi:hypothetical protein J6590_082953 [Homalodisca vitripennis]|nr:hypothetical protein J6590_082953 [Homalodisca vitripennis]
MRPNLNYSVLSVRARVNNMSCITEHLLEVVYTYPVLYDLNHKDYKNIRKKDKIWEDIGKTLNTSGVFCRSV